jgi:two-component system sensor histidine kinase FlrB
MTNLPRTRQRKRNSNLEEKKRDRAQQTLARAFVTFTRAAGSLEKSYEQLHGEVARLREELQHANTELERSLEENSRVRGYLACILEHLPCGVLVEGDGRQVQLVNPEARRLLSLPADWNAVAEQALPGGLEKLFAGATPASFFSEQEWPAGSIAGNRSIGILRSKISSNPGEEGGTVWILRDVTEQKRLAAEREAARRTQALAEIAAVLAHEIRNPLGSMELFAGLLGDATSHMPETRQWVTHLQAGLRSLSATVNNVLQFHGQAPPELLPTDLGRLLGETTEFLGPLARQRNQQVTLENRIGKAATQADPHRLKQVFFNLALNAFRAMTPGGKLAVRLGWAPQFPEGIVQIDFQDQGQGIAEENLDRIFEPGFTTSAGNPGLGLSVCQRVIAEHGGEIRVSSKTGQGSTFTIYLPVTGASE